MIRSYANLLSQSTDVFLFGDARHGASSIEYFFNLIKHDLIDKELLNNLVQGSIINLVENFKKLLNENGISNESINLFESGKFVFKFKYNTITRTSKNRTGN